jgi:four helix bundle protein
MIKTYQELIVWQKAIKLTLLVYKLTATFPKGETYGLVSQMCRAAVSIASNIAEGWARKNTAEFINFLSMANGSVAELQTQLVIAKELGYGETKFYEEIGGLLVEVQKIIPAMMVSLKRSNR